MRKIIAITVSFLISVSLLTFPVFAQDNHTTREEKEGEVVWEKLQANQINCDKLNDEDFERLGEYFMGQSIGDTQRHATMNQMMISMMGEDGEEQMHVVIGKRLSGCDTTAALPQGSSGFMPMMMNMMTGFGETKGGVNTMMSYGNMMGWGGFGFLFSFFWIVILVDLILLGVWLWKKITKEKK